MALALSLVFACASHAAAVVPGFYQKLYTTGQLVTTGDPETDAGNAVVDAAGLTFAGNSYTYGGKTYTVGGNTTAAYVTYMAMTAGTTYRFVKNYDDAGRIVITDPAGTETTILSCTSYNADTYGHYTPTVSGWYRLDLRVGNGGGGVGPTKTPFSDLLKAGLAWTDSAEVTSDKCTTANYTHWRRFENVGANYFYTGKMGIYVAGEPSAIGNPEPGYGMKTFSTYGESCTFTCPAVYTNDAETIGATSLGYRFELTNGTVVAGAAVSTSIVYSVEAANSTLTWRWNAHFKATVAQPTYGTVTQSAADGWYAAGESATFTATPNANCAVYCWTVDGVRAGGKGQNAFSVTMDAPHEVTAIIGRAWYVAKAGTDAGNASGDASHPFLTISNGVAHAAACDSVVVGDGVYEITAEIAVTNAVLVRSANGKSVTEIRRVNVRTDETASIERCVRLAHAEATVDGFTISNGRNYYYAGSHDTSYDGAGVLIDTAGGTLQNCSVTNCLHGGNAMYGAGLAMRGSSAVVTNCVISDNRMGYLHRTKDSGWNCYGGGVYMTGGLIVDSVIARNTNIAGNDVGGGGLYVTGGTVRRTQFLENLIDRSSGRGGGAFVAANGVTFEDCLFARNRTNNSSGGGVYSGRTTSFMRCTFADNEANAGAGGCFDSSGCTLTDCVFGGNQTYSDVSSGAPEWSGNANAVYVNCLAAVPFTAKSTGCVLGTPCFMDADYTLSPASALQGIGWKVPSAGTADFVRTGDNCIVGEDIVFTYGIQGSPASRATFTANYATPGTYSVTHGGVTKSVRVSAKDLYVAAGGDIQSVVDQAEDGATVHVAADTYTITEQIFVTNGISLVSDDGSADTIVKRSATKPKSGDDVAQRCIKINHPRARVIGFTARDGWSYAATVTYTMSESGPGIWLGPRGGYLEDAVVTGCEQYGVVRGGALMVFGRNSLATNVTVTANKGSSWRCHGAGVYISGGGTVTHATITDNKITTGNQNGGAGVYAYAGRLTHARISGNTICNQEGGGAGLYAASADFVCDNCLICGNTATERPGGGIYATAGTFVNCTVVGNSAKQGGGIYANSTNVKVHNCIIQGNTVTGDTSDGAPEWNGANTKYSYSVSTKELPTADSSNRVGTVTMEAGSNYKIAAGSLAFDAGSTNTFAAYAGETDIDDGDRVWGEAIDMGCCEFYSNDRYAASVKVPDGVILQDRPATYTASIVNPQKLTLVCVWTVEGESFAPVTNESFTVSLATPGYRTINLRVYDGDAGKDFPVTVYVTPHDLYVVPPDTPDHAAAFPYATAASAATNLCDAVLAANDGSTVHLSAGLHLVTNEVAVNAGMTVLGDTGATNTIVRRAELKKTSTTRYRVLSMNHADAVIRGVSIANGYLEDQNSRGAGIYMGALGGTLADSIVSNNYMYANMYTYGCGIYMAGGTVTNCLICCNTNMTQSYDGAYGGGICVNRGQVLESRIERNRFIYNSRTKPTSAQQGGAGGTVNGTGVFRNCLFANNVSEGATGGLNILNGCKAYVTNCTFYGNVATTSVVMVWGTYERGAASGLDFVASATYSGLADVVNTAFSTNVVRGGGVSNVGTNACIVKTAVMEVQPTAFKGAADGNFKPGHGSPLASRGIYVPWMSSAVDLAGEPRVYGKHTVDVGAIQGNHGGLVVIFR